MGCMGSVLQLPPDSWGTQGPPGYLALSRGIGWPLMLTWDMWVGLFFPAGHNPGALLEAALSALVTPAT